MHALLDSDICSSLIPPFARYSQIRWDPSPPQVLMVQTLTLVEFHSCTQLLCFYTAAVFSANGTTGGDGSVSPVC